MDGLVSHALIGRIREGHGRCHRDAVASMDAHGVEVFDGADDGDVVGAVAQQLQFEFFPAQHGFFHQHFVGRRHVEPPAQGGIKFVFFVDEAASRAAQGVRRADN